MKTKITIIALILTGICQLVQAQSYTRQDSLRGSITPERAWWDLKYYHLDISVNPKDSTLNGSVTVNYQVLESYQVMQIDLQEPLLITKVLDSKGQELSVNHEGNAHFITLKEKQVPNEINEVKVFYSGQPKVAVRPPWDGGVTWEKDAKGKDIIHTNCQGIGASVWWPNKDHLYDEPDSMLISVRVPKGLMDVSNGRLRSVDKHKDGSRTYNWFVTNPISNYVISLNIAEYTHFSETYDGEKGELDMNYYVFPQHLKDAKRQFADAKRMMEAFEHWFGPYPFYEDGYKLVEVTSTGMEHQSAVTYGNGFKNGYRGRDGSGTGWGFKFDFIIIHESGHEWFANNITYKDIADMWIHESFTNYSESLFIEYFYGKEAGQAYVRGNRRSINNDRPIIGDYDVNVSGSGDMYVKGGNMLNTLRTIINDDEKWRAILRGLNETFYHQTVTTEQIEGYIAEQAGMQLNPFFDQYLRTTSVPVFEYYFLDGQFFYRWNSCVADFDMPAKVAIGDQEEWLYPTKKWSSLSVEGTPDIKLDPNLYAATLLINEY